MRRGVYAQCQAADDGEAGATESARELLRVAYPLMRGVAAAHHGQAGEREQLAPAAQIQERRRIGRLEQRPRIIVVGKRDNGVAVGRRPFQCRLDGGGIKIR